MPKRPVAAIPDDWDGETWTCVKVWWPDSTLWRAILTGLITMPQRGRHWDRDTGTITEAQEVGREIFARSYPFEPCGADQAPVPAAPEIVYVAVPCEPEDDDMNCRAPCIRWNGNVLEVFDCGEWIAVPTIAGTSHSLDRGTIPTYPDPGDPGEGEDAACRKAYVIADAMSNVFTSVNDHKGMVIPWQFVSKVQSELPGLTLGATALLSAQLVLNVYDFFTEGTMYPSDWARVRCHLARTLSDNYEMDESQYLKGHAAVATTWSDLLDPEEVLGKNAIAILLYEAIGRGTLNELAHSAAMLEEEPDCTCPGAGGGGPWEELDWWQEFDMEAISDPYTTISYGNFVLGVGFVTEEYGGGQLWGAYIDPDHSGGGTTTLEFMRIEVSGSWAWPSGGTRYLLNAVGGSAQLTLDDVTDGVAEWAGSEGIPADNFQLQHNVISGSALADPQIIKRIIVGGSGVNPFE